MERLDRFISEHKGYFAGDDGDTFAFAFGKVLRRCQFLEVIHQRYLSESEAFVENRDRFLARLRGQSKDITPEQQKLWDEGRLLGVALHLEIESFYLFAKIALDDVARAIEHYFGAARSCALDSHDDLTKRLTVYAEAKGLTVTRSLLANVADLKRRISDFRDYQIAHEKSPRTLVATMWDTRRGVRMSQFRVPSRASDKHVQSESLERLREAVHAYIDDVIAFIEANKEKTRLRISTTAQG